MKGLSTEQNVHKSMNIVHDLATLSSLSRLRFTRPFPPGGARRVGT